MKRFFTLLLILLVTARVASAQCNAGFTFTANQSTVSFTGSANNPGLFHYWYFGDGQNGFGQNTSHSYNSPGTYNVIHTVYDSLNACRDSLVQAVTVNFTAVCQASFLLSYDSANYNYGIYCYSNSTYSGTGIQTYIWTVNGTVQGGNDSVLYFNASPGSNNICLSIVTTAGCTSSYCDTITMPASCNFNPSFSYTASPGNSRTISFTPSPDQASLKYFWNFGDGYTSTARRPVHTYNLPASYPVKLTVLDSAANCLDTVRQLVNVVAGPGDSCTASFSYSLNNYGLANFTASGNQAITSQSWLIYNLSRGDSVIIIASNPSHQFVDTGSYMVCVTLTTNTGCIRTYCDVVFVQTVSGRYAETIPSFPNPVRSGDINMSMNLGAAGLVELKVFDVSGNIVWRGQQQGQMGTNIIKIPADSLKRGQYFVEVCYRYKLKRSIFQKL